MIFVRVEKAADARWLLLMNPETPNPLLEEYTLNHTRDPIMI